MGCYLGFCNGKHKTSSGYQKIIVSAVNPLMNTRPAFQESHLVFMQAKDNRLGVQKNRRRINWAETVKTPTPPTNGFKKR